MAWSRMEAVGQSVDRSDGAGMEGEGGGGEEVMIQTQMAGWMVLPFAAIQKAWGK